MKQLLFFCVLAMITAAPVVQGEVPNTISYQGFITENGDTLTGNHNFRFNIYDAETVGDLLWTENHTGVMLNGGLFHVILGNSTSLAAIAFDQPYWFGIEVDGGQELPCIEMASSAYSLNARTVMDDAVTSAKIKNSTIQFEDIGQNGASDGKVMKWVGGAWITANDSTGDGVSDHGELTGLDHDDHPQYLHESLGGTITGTVVFGDSTMRVTSQSVQIVPFQPNPDILDLKLRRSLVDLVIQRGISYECQKKPRSRISSPRYSSKYSA